MLAGGTAVKTGKRKSFLSKDFINIVKISSHFHRRMETSSTHGITHAKVSFLGVL